MAALTAIFSFLSVVIRSLVLFVAKGTAIVVKGTAEPIYKSQASHILVAGLCSKAICLDTM